MVDTTGTAFDKVSTGTAQIKDLISEIAAASKEQAQGIEQVNTAVAEMDKVTQETTTNAQNSASAADAMKIQATRMTGMMDELLALFSRRTETPADRAARKRQPAATNRLNASVPLAPRTGHQVKGLVGVQVEPDR